jgi:hypothetical protein
MPRNKWSVSDRLISVDGIMDGMSTAAYEAVWYLEYLGMITEAERIIFQDEFSRQRRQVDRAQKLREIVKLADELGIGLVEGTKK